MILMKITAYVCFISMCKLSVLKSVASRSSINGSKFVCMQPTDCGRCNTHTGEMCNESGWFFQCEVVDEFMDVMTSLYGSHGELMWM